MSTPAALPHHPQAEITADPHIPAIRIERDFDATPEQLIRAHTDPDLFARWCGPNKLPTGEIPSKRKRDSSLGA